jgi:hypothetical protein
MLRDLLRAGLTTAETECTMAGGRMIVVTLRAHPDGRIAELRCPDPTAPVSRAWGQRIQKMETHDTCARMPTAAWSMPVPTQNKITGPAR